MTGLILGNGDIIQVYRSRRIKITGCDWINIIVEAYKEGSLK